ncbi:citryl-CoA lyase [Roseovarius mucosus]|uniref:citryl-CoA lyase n=1 Tax=Roseovarius mucosus TaxID=215743 RepID=UPI003F70D05C
MTKARHYDPAEEWWSTQIIEMEPGVIRYHGFAIEDLIGNISFPAMIWLMLRGDLPTGPQEALLGTALASAVDHGPQAPSIAIARMAATCGVGINNAMASAINVLGDVHGGAGEECVAFFNAIAAHMAEGTDLADAIDTEIDALTARGIRHVPGYGHRFHAIDPRAPRLMAVLRAAEGAEGVIPGMADIAEGVEATLATRKGRPIPLNIDGATAAIYAALGFAPPLCRGLFVLSRSVGALAHTWEQMQQGGRNKGPIPRNLTWRYTGKAARQTPDATQSKDKGPLEDV